MGKLWIFLTAFIQVALVTAQTWMIARLVWVGILVVGFLISLVWTINVKRVAFGGWTDRLIYASGAGVGAIVGVFVARLVSGGGA